jgi:uroporphyrinogen-III synthase
MSHYTVLSTKKLLPSLKKDAMEDGIAILEQEFINILPVLSDENISAVKNFTVIKDLTVVFTSSNAVENLLALLASSGISGTDLHWNIFCLQGLTQNTITSKMTGCNILGNATDASSLARTIIDHGSVKKLVFFCGNKRRDELPDLLKARNIELQELVVYETLETPVTIPGPMDAVLFFSPSAVNSFFSANQIEKNTTCFAIGATTAKVIASYTGNKIISSTVPDQAVLMQTLRSYFQNINCYE